MQRRVLFAAITGLAMAAGLRPAAAQQAWDDITGPEGRFRVRIPAGDHRIRAAANGVIIHTYVTVLPGPFAFEFIDVAFENPRPALEGAGLATALEQMQGGMQRSFPGATLVEQRPITTGPLAGREFVLSTEAGARFVRTRLYLTAASAYTATVQGPIAERQNPAIAQFFDSIQFG